MSVEKPEELQTTPPPQAAALTDAERAELEALRAEKERRELEALRAEKERAEFEALRAEKTRAAQFRQRWMQQRKVKLSSVLHVRQLSRRPSKFVAFRSSAQRAVLSWSQMKTTKTSKCLWGKKLLSELW